MFPEWMTLLIIGSAIGPAIAVQEHTITDLDRNTRTRTSSGTFPS